MLPEHFDRRTMRLWNCERVGRVASLYSSFEVFKIRISHNLEMPSWSLTKSKEYLTMAVEFLSQLNFYPLRPWNIFERVGKWKYFFRTPKFHIIQLIFDKKTLVVREEWWEFLVCSYFNPLKKAIELLVNLKLRTVKAYIVNQNVLYETS